jgi:hypothetical protein
MLDAFFKTNGGRKMNGNMKNDLIEALLVTGAGLSANLTPEQAERERELARRCKEYALQGYIMTGKPLFTEDREKS